MYLFSVHPVSKFIKRKQALLKWYSLNLILFDLTIFTLIFVMLL